MTRPVPDLEVPAIFKFAVEPKAKRPSQRANQSNDGNRAYMRHITAIDGCAGRLLNVLENTGQLDNTIIIVASDNGYYLGEHEMGDKQSAYDESMPCRSWFASPANRLSAA